MPSGEEEREYFAVKPEKRAIVIPSNNSGGNKAKDLRDLLISQQIRRIDELEHQVALMDTLLHTHDHDASDPVPEDSPKPAAMASA